MGVALLAFCIDLYLHAHVFTLVPEVFHGFLRMRETRSIEQKLQSNEKEKPLVTLDLNLTFMQTAGLDLLGLELVDVFTNTQINIIGSFDWHYREDGGRSLTALLEVNFANLYQGKIFFAKYFRSQFIHVQDFPVFDMDFVS